MLKTALGISPGNSPFIQAKQGTQLPDQVTDTRSRRAAWYTWDNLKFCIFIASQLSLDSQVHPAQNWLSMQPGPVTMTLSTHFRHLSLAFPLEMLSWSPYHILASRVSDKTLLSLSQHGVGRHCITLNKIINMPNHQMVNLSNQKVSFPQTILGKIFLCIKMKIFIL